MALFKDIGIDLGTANTLVYTHGKGIVLREPSVVAVNTDNGKVLAVGNDAKNMIGRTPGNIIAVRPLKEGVIADFNTTQSMLSYFIKKVCGTSFIKPNVLICIPGGVTEVERRAVEEAAMQAGAKQAFLMEEPMSAAVGAGLPVQSAMGSMVVDIGGGTTEVAVISLGGIVTCMSLRTAGDDIDESIIQYVRKKHNLLLGERTAEEIKITIGCAMDSGFNMVDESVEVRGRNLVSGLPNALIITKSEVCEAIAEQVSAIIDSIKTTLEKTPPELASDIMENGIVLTGGGALLQDLDKLIQRETGIHTRIADNPLDCVARGTGIVLSKMGQMNKLLLKKATR